MTLRQAYSCFDNGKWLLNVITNSVAQIWCGIEQVIPPDRDVTDTLCPFLLKLSRRAWKPIPDEEARARRRRFLENGGDDGSVAREDMGIIYPMLLKIDSDYKEQVFDVYPVRECGNHRKMKEAG
jgi:hypothetical protein